MIHEYKVVWQRFRGMRMRWQVLIWVGVALVVIGVIGNLAGSGNKATNANSVRTVTVTTQAPTTTPTTSAPDPDAVMSNAVRARLNAEFPARTEDVSCTGSYSCALTSDGATQISLIASGTSSRAIAAKFTHVIETDAARAKAEAIAKARAASRKRRLAAQRAAKAKAAKVLKAHERTALLDGSQTGQSMAQVKYLMGAGPDSVQRITGIGTIWYYTFYLTSGSEYQIIFGDGQYVSEVNQY